MGRVAIETSIAHYNEKDKYEGRILKCTPTLSTTTKSVGCRIALASHEDDDGGRIWRSSTVRMQRLPGSFWSCLEKPRLSGGSVLRGVVILPQTKARRFTKKQHLHKDRRVRTL